MGEADKPGLSGTGKCGQETKREAGAEGSGFQSAGLPSGLRGVTAWRGSGELPA
jgi:hypothetical protein